MRKILIFVLFMMAAAVSFAQTDIYNRYSSRTDIRVASVTNFTLDTGITADVTLLEAIDEPGWEYLCNEFSLATPSPEQQEQMRAGWDVVMFTQRMRSDPTQPVQVSDDQVSQSGTCYLGVSYLSQTVYIFCCTSDQQSDMVVNYLIQKMKSMRR